jgi:autoinducer 2-degrading protein
VGTFVLDSKKFIPGVTNQNIVAGLLEGHTAAIRNLFDIGQISKTAVIQTDSSRRWFGKRIVASANSCQRGFLQPPMLLFFWHWITARQRGNTLANITFIARMTVKEGREQEFIGHCQALAEKVAENEPDILYYRFFKLREPRTYAVLESFADEAAEEVHMNTEYLAKIAPPLLDCLDGDPPYVREYLDPIDS